MVMIKNIHLLPTDKPSRICKSIIGLHLTKPMISTNDVFINQNIYITSDEEIKEGDWTITLPIKEWTKPIRRFIENSYDLDKNDKKIILTTDQDLIKDGVQAIDDEFLEWFIKNSSCEFLNVTKQYKDGYGNWYNYQDDFKFTDVLIKYKIIIPKEEIKIIECYFIPSTNTSSSTICSNCEQEKFLHTIGEGIKVSTYIVNTKEESKQEGKVLTVKEVMEERSNKYEFIDFDKQETLEEAFNIHYKNINYTEDSIYKEAVKRDFIEGWNKGAKWQQERSYSEEEVLKIITLSRQIKDYKETFDLDGILGLTEICTHNWKLFSEKEILEQFKKK